MRKGFLTATAFATIAMVTATVSTAKAEGPVEMRVQAMKDTGAAMRVLAKAAKGESEISLLQEIAAKTVANTGKSIPDMFPAGTGPGGKGIGETRAKAEIWSDWKGFTAQATALEEAGAALLAAVEAGDRAALGAALDQAGKSCGGCHKPYRAPKQ